MRSLYPILLLMISNVFMTFAWYGHLRFKSYSLWIVILSSWLIAFFEYCFQVPANRIGHEFYSATQLKIMQEIITLIVFVFFSVWYLKEDFRWNYAVGFGLILLAVFFVFKKWNWQYRALQFAIHLFLICLLTWKTSKVRDFFC